MKKYIILLLVGIFSLLSVAALAQTDASANNPGMLPSSPFYFLKEWKRGTVRFFTFNSEKKAELELKEVEERAAEIKKLEEVSPEKTEALTKAAENYQENVERLKTRLEGLKETSENPNVEKLIEKVIDRSIEHQELFDGLQEKLMDKDQVKEQLQINREKIEEFISGIPEQLRDSEAIKEKLELREANQVKELNQIRELNQVSSSSGATIPSAVKKEILEQEAPAGLSPLKNINSYLQEKKEQIEERKREQNYEEVKIDLPVATSTAPFLASSTISEAQTSSTLPAITTSTSQY
jgi:DNA repair exonuclease SbcCD ATPase subunit